MVWLSLHAALLATNVFLSRTVQSDAVVSTHRAGVSPLLNHAASTPVTLAASNHTSIAPCTCETWGVGWKAATRTTPKCVFIDLGAEAGQSFHAFLDDSYGSVKGCPSGQWEAHLVEAHPRFNLPLEQISARFPGSAHVSPSTAAYDCDATATMHFEGGVASLATTVGQSQRKDSDSFQVRLLNLNRLLFENTIPGDWVMVKMDVDGVEYDILPCLAKAEVATLVDRLYVQQYDASKSSTGTTQVQMQEAIDQLRKRGVDVPSYFTQH